MEQKRRESELNTILEKLTEELDLTPTQYNDARGKYRAVGDWIGKPDSPLEVYSPTIYPQGSIRLGTAVKPLVRDEFDVDLVCQLQIPFSIAPEDLKKMVGGRLRDNETYRRIIKEMNRCWQLQYAGQFHMDVLPGVPDGRRGNGCILVPDRDLQTWKESNPRGYAEWFDTRMIEVRKRLRAMLVAKADVQDLPDDYQIKTPLQRSVQLLKRHRDISFQDDKENAPISIIITTLAAKAYNNSLDLYEALLDIIREMPNQLELQNGRPAVLNPTNPAENFAEKWQENPGRYEAFKQWLIDLRIQLDQLLQVQGLDNLANGLSPLFGTRSINTAIENYAKAIQAERESGSLRVSVGTGTLGSSGVVVPRNTFYGES